MRISLLLEREPFGQILAATLARYWTERLGTTVDVRWAPETESPPPGALTWYCNPRLNTIFTADATSAVFGPARREFARAISPLRRPAQALYVRLATSSAFAKRIAWPALYVTPAIPDASSTSILGGNNRIRLINFRTSESHVVAKEGFDSDLIAHELDVRTGSSTLAPKITFVDKARRWFTEECIAGTPLNRLASSATNRASLSRASTALHELHQSTQTETPLANHASALETQINALAQAHPWLTDAMRSTIQTLTDTITTTIDSLVTAVPNIQIAQTHGDFQPANILVSGNDVWQIDWEYTAQRHITYDPLVYHLQARSPVGLAQRFKALSDGSTLDALNVAWPWFPWDAPEQRIGSLVIFLLEELVFRLEESNNPMFYGLDPGVPNYLSELQEAVDHLPTALL